MDNAPDAELLLYLAEFGDDDDPLTIERMMHSLDTADNEPDRDPSATDDTASDAPPEDSEDSRR